CESRGPACVADFCEVAENTAINGDIARIEAGNILREIEIDGGALSGGKNEITPCDGERRRGDIRAAGEGIAGARVARKVGVARVRDAFPARRSSDLCESRGPAGVADFCEIAEGAAFNGDIARIEAGDILGKIKIDGGA